MRIASQLEPFFNSALQGALGLPVIAVRQGAPEHLPQDVFALIAAPIDLVAPMPAGWPFGLQWIQLVTSGTDKHPDWLLHGRPASTARGVAAQQIAEYVVAAIFYQTKQLDTLWVHHPGQWQTRALPGVADTTVGLIGLGAIGEAIARKLVPLGAQVKAYRQRPLAPSVAGVSLVNSVTELLASVDHLVLAAPATPQTHHLLNRQTLAKAKPGLHIINVARGELIDDSALLEALELGLVGSATLDVTSPEPLPADHAFYHHERIRMSPHTSAIGTRSRLALVDKVVANHRRWLAGLGLLDPVVPSDAVAPA